MLRSDKNLLLILKLACFFLFAGRAWQHLVWDIPMRTLLWDQDIMEQPIQWLTGMTWFEYATSDIQDQVLQSVKVSLGVFYAICAGLSLWINKSCKWMGKTILVGGLLLVGLSFLYYKEKFFHLGQLFEYSSQLFIPVLLYMVLFTNIAKKQLILMGKVAVGLTFTCHGLYALGYYPQPGHFVDMMINGFYISEDVARNVLWLVGVIDIVISVGIFIPRVWKYCMWYAVVWGLMTAVARVTTNFYIDFPLETLNQWTPQMLYRLPHGLLPLILIGWQMGIKETKDFKSSHSFSSKIPFGSST